MPLNIGQALPSTASTATSQLSTARQLSSGERIGSAKNDAAGMAIVKRLDADLSGLDVALRNAGDAGSFAQTVDGALSAITRNLARVQELSLQSANATLMDQDRRALDVEAQALLDDTRNLAENSEFNGKALLSGDAGFSVQFSEAGEGVELASVDVLAQLEESALFDVDLSTQSGAQVANERLQNAQALVTERRAEVGAFANSLEGSIERLSTTRIATAAARSQQGDSDVAASTSAAVIEQVQAQVDIAIRGQANAKLGFVQQLLGG